MPTRRGKGYSSRSTTPNPSEKKYSSNTTGEKHGQDGNDVDNDPMKVEEEDNKRQSLQTVKDTRGKRNTQKDAKDPLVDNDSQTDISHNGPVSMDELESMVLTSEKRQNIYECDYCHQDISQQPRIRCAVCSDFDLCLDCFATSDHQAMIARIKATSHTQNELVKDGIDSTNLVGVAISSAAANHDSTHGYRVCDSTRYPVFATGRVFAKAKTTTSIVAGAAPSARSVASSTTKGNDNDEDNANEKKDDNNAMDVDSEEEQEDAGEEGVKSTASSGYAPSNTDAVSVVSEILLSEDPKFVWTAEEDLRLIDAIKTHGLGNWLDISEAISGNGSMGKTPKRCMERYFDDFLGRYGHILPPWTAVDDEIGSNGVDDDDGQDKVADGEQYGETSTISAPETLANYSTTGGDEEDVVRSYKRQRTSTSRSSSGLLTQNSILGSRTKKKLKVVPTESLPNYDKIWPKPYMPPTGVEVGQEVARDLAYRAELAFVKATMAATSKEEADKIRKDWDENRMGHIGSPTVLPPRPEDAIHLPGSELAGFMPRRGDFDIEWNNDAEQSLADMEFTRADTPQERQLKLQVLDIYCQKLDEREKRKNFILSRHLYDYRKYIEDDQKLPQDERDLVSRMRMYERFHTPEEHKQFITDILKAKRLRKEIAKLQMYRRIGIRSLAEAEKYELDKNRRQFHKMAQMQREADAKAKTGIPSTASTAKPDASSAGSGTLTSYEKSQRVPPDSLWKKYKSSDRKARRNSSRGGTLMEDSEDKMTEASKTPGGGMSAEIDGEKKTDEQKKSEASNETERTLNDELKEDNRKTESEERADPPDHRAKDPSSSINAEIDDFDITGSRGLDLLSKKECNLCKTLRIYPIQYLEIKKALIHEALMKGMLDGSSTGHGKRTIVKIDVERRGNIIDFMIRAGWISREIGDAAMRVVTPPPTQQIETKQGGGPLTSQPEDVEMKTD
ncbi:Myb-like DNA-binding protein [Nitzschia inconspicua]|uniref:Myb-like DNA-binding protein n=1 Tax=Nitzschia inconspicua TaxID=303405 RepID=A0A9K3PD00_9STRA|nr:Myb-like DNA-binding protein [Nitzschia inconspicua]